MKTVLLESETEIKKIKKNLPVKQHAKNMIVNCVYICKEMWIYKFIYLLS